MASQLHARKKHVAEDEVHQLEHLLHNDTPKSGKRQRRRRGEDQCAALAVAVFLVLGLFLGYFLLHHQHRRVILHVIRDPWSHGSAVFRRKKQGFHHHFYSGPPRFVTVVMPSVVNPNGRSRRLDSIHKTWGPYARAIFVLHNQTEFPQGSHLTFSEEKEPSDTFSYPQTLLLPDLIGVDDGLPRLYYTIRSIHEKVDPDFCFFVNDHTFVIPEHLCSFLDGHDPEDDLYAGHALRNGKEDVFNSGAAGYLLSRGTMKKLMQKWDEHADKCWMGPDASSWLQGNPGLVTAQCLESIGIHAIDTREDGKWHRFHAFPLTRVVAGKVDGWYNKKHDGMENFDGFDKSYSELLKGEDCCAKGTVSFHYVEYLECKALFATREALIRKPHMSDEELKTLILNIWPKDRSDYGFYSMVLPKVKNDEEWKPLLAVIRKISNPFTPDADCLLM